MQNISIAYGSESGNAKRLAKTLAEQFTTKGLAIKHLGDLNSVDLDRLTQTDLLLIITSSFGDGEPTGNACDFYERLCSVDQANCQFAVFGLGDVAYPRFCGFSKIVDDSLRQKGGKAIAKRVDADTDFQAFFDQWSIAVIKHCQGDSQPLLSLKLQVKAYSENDSFPATIQSVTRLDTGEFPVYDIHIDITGSGMSYRAGDLLYILPPPNAKTFARIINFYNNLTDEQCKTLKTKELRHLSKPLFRALAKLTHNEALKQLTKVSAAKQFNDYCYGRDIADVLHDYCSPEQVPIEALLTILSGQLPRAYSIASCGKKTPDSIRLCVREVAYHQNGIDYTGTASHFLAHAKSGDTLDVYVRDNLHFHAPKDSSKPMILIATGAGIAPHMGFLAQPRKGEIHLFFGDRHQQHDFLYHDELQEHLAKGQLTTLYTAFSRDQSSKIYVQDRILEQGKKIWTLLENDAEIYVCGNKSHLGKSLDKILCEIAKTHAQMSEDDTKQWLYNLSSTGRYHQDLY